MKLPINYFAFSSKCSGSIKKGWVCLFALNYIWINILENNTYLFKYRNILHFKYIYTYISYHDGRLLEVEMLKLQDELWKNNFTDAINSSSNDMAILTI